MSRKLVAAATMAAALTAGGAAGFALGAPLVSGAQESTTTTDDGTGEDGTTTTDDGTSEDGTTTTDDGTSDDGAGEEAPSGREGHRRGGPEGCGEGEDGSDTGAEAEGTAMT